MHLVFKACQSLLPFVFLFCCDTSLHLLSLKLLLLLAIICCFYVGDEKKCCTVTLFVLPLPCNPPVARCMILCEGVYIFCSYVKVDVTCQSNIHMEKGTLFVLVSHCSFLISHCIMVLHCF